MTRETMSDEMRAEIRAMVEAEVKSYWVPCLDTKDGKWCGKRNRHRGEHHYFLDSPDAI